MKAFSRVNAESYGSCTSNDTAIPSWENCPAKSEPFKSIRQHALETGAVFEALRNTFHFPEELLPPEALLFAMGHDCGKLSPGFLCKLPGNFARKNGIRYMPEYQRHEVISEAAFAVFLKGRSDRCETIAGYHHGRRDSTPQPDGAIDYGGSPWQARRREFLEWITTKFTPPPRQPFSPENRLLTAGIVCLADWIASDEKNFAATDTLPPFDELKRSALEVVQSIGFRHPEFKPGLRFEEIFPPYSPNPGQLALAELATGPGVYLLENTMGSGKTEAALFAAYRLIASGVNRGMFFALPTRLTSNKIHERVNAFLNRVSGSDRARLIHGTAWLEPAGGGELAAGHAWFAPAKRALLEPFGVGTVDQALKGVLNVRHFFVRLAGLAGKVVIIDEVHAYDEYMHYLLIRLCRILVRLDCTVILLSATLPEQRRAELLDSATEVTSPSPSSRGYPALTAHARGAVPQERTFAPSLRRRVKVTTVTPEEVIAKATAAAAQGCNVAVIADTVGDAQSYFGAIRSAIEANRFPVGLLHSRFPLWRREEIEEKWLGALGKEAGEKRPEGSILVSTQIIEQSVDMDFDLIISDIAPSDLLFQRMGRLWRHERAGRPNAEPEFCRIHRDLCSAPTAEEVLQRAAGGGRVYPPFLLFRAEAVWREITHVMLPGEMRSILEENFQLSPGAGAVERQLYEQMKSDAQTQINKAGVAAQLDLLTSVSAAASDRDEDAPTRLSDCPQQNLLLLNAVSVCGKICQLTLSDQSALTCGEGEAFSLEKMRLLAANTVPVPAWWVKEVEDSLPKALETYYRYDSPVAAQIGPDGGLTLPDGTPLPIRYDNDNGVCHQAYGERKEEDETLSADW